MLSSLKRKERSPLLYFYGVECSHCDLMDPLIKQLEDETGMTLRKFEVWYNDDNLRLLQRLDKDGLCNGVPFFYSKMKRDWICGATIYPNFKAWALGKPHERFLVPPTEDNNEVVGQFKNIFDRLKTEKFQNMRERMEAGKKRAGEMPEGQGDGKNGSEANGAVSNGSDKSKNGGEKQAVDKLSAEKQVAQTSEDNEVVGQFKNIFGRLQNMRERMEAGKKRAGEMPEGHGDGKDSSEANGSDSSASEKTKNGSEKQPVDKIPAERQVVRAAGFVRSIVPAGRSAPQRKSAFDAYSGVLMPNVRVNTCATKPSLS